MSEISHTPGPWPLEYTGDGKRIVIGNGLVEGPNGYEVAEVYSDDCPQEIAKANARLIAAAPELFEACKALDALWVADWEPPHPDPEQQEPRIITKECLDIWRNIRAAIANATGATQ